MDEQERPAQTPDEVQADPAERAADQAGGAGFTLGEDPQRVRDVVGRRSHDEPGEVDEDPEGH